MDGSYQLHPPPLEELASVLQRILQESFEMASVSVVECPDLRKEPFGLAAQGLSGSERIADVGGQTHLYPAPVLTARYSLMSVAEEMGLTQKAGMLIGAGAGPYFDVGANNELAPNISWQVNGDDSDPTVKNLTYYTRVNEDKSISCEKCPTTNFALMMNLYGSEGLGGPVIKIAARKNTSGKGLTDCIRFGLRDHYGTDKPVSLGGVFLIKTGVARFHVMPDFPPSDELPWASPKKVNEWLTWHNFSAPIVCLTVMHTGDPGHRQGRDLGLRMEHTHCFAVGRDDQGGHYHHDITGDDVDDVEYEAYFNTAKVLFRMDQPNTGLEKDLHD